MARTLARPTLRANGLAVGFAAAVAIGSSALLARLSAAFDPFVLKVGLFGVLFVALVGVSAAFLWISAASGVDLVLATVLVSIGLVLAWNGAASMALPLAVLLVVGALVGGCLTALFRWVPA